MNQLKTKSRLPSTFKTVALTFVITVILGLAIGYFFFSDKQLKIVSPVEMAEVKLGNLNVEVVAEGELIPVRTHLITVPESFFSDFSVTEIEIISLNPEGAKVERGETIGQLDMAVYEAFKQKIDTEIADLESKMGSIVQDTTKQLKDVKLALENARLDLEIRKISVEQSLFDPASAHERMKLEFSKSTLAYENALANYNDRRKTLLDQYDSYPERLEKLISEERVKLPALRKALAIESPYRGVLSYIKEPNGAKRSAGHVITTKNRGIAEVEATGSLVSLCYLDEEYFSEVREGQDIKVFLKSNSIETEAQISKVNRQVVTVGGNKVFAIETIIDNSGYELLPGQTTVNKILLYPLENVLYLPQTSIVEEGDKSFVYLDGGIKHEVRCKKVNSEFAHIISGLTEGQSVYLNASAAGS